MSLKNIQEKVFLLVRATTKKKHKHGGKEAREKTWTGNQKSMFPSGSWLGLCPWQKHLTSWDPSVLIS